MELRSVNIGSSTMIVVNGRNVPTGIFKEPVEHPVMVTRRTLEGDRQVDLKVHGGPEKAVYAYPFEHYAFWEQELERHDFAFGQFGENLTTIGMLEQSIHIGDSFRIGQAVLEVSQPRIPCFKLAVKMGQPDFPKRFVQSLRSGFYFRVLEEGEIQAGMSIEPLESDPPGISVQDVYQHFFFDRNNVETTHQLLEHPKLSIEWKSMLRDG